MSRQGSWGRVASNFWKYIKGDFSKKNYVAEDASGNRFYEISNSRQNVSRGFDPPVSGAEVEPGLEWQAWLKGTRRFPPSDSEISINRMRQQAQLAQDSNTEKRAPRVQSETKSAGDKPQTFPKYNDLEVSPGYQERKGK
uniref:NADH:ubiquinone oxidoreductase complex assembly factor 2 n=1 Tax=Caenorhabditis tropicalis TaxID=1561998 RepID=A0A1I7V4P7_9PELO